MSRYPKFMLTVDPGASVGWAIWDYRKLKAKVPPLHWGCVNRGIGDWVKACDRTCNNLMGGIFSSEFDIREFEIVVCEYPKYYGQGTGQASAARGDLVKLAIMVGRIHQLLKNQTKRFEYVDVNTWKGQLQKGQVNKHIVRVLGSSFCTRLGKQSHHWDAVGIGLWYKGFM